MKNTKVYRHFAGLIAGAALIGAAASSHAQSVTSSITNRFDVTNSCTGWTYWYDLYQSQGYNVVILDWDSNYNNGGLAGSGSVKYKTVWPGVPAGTAGVGGQNQIWGTFAHTGANQYDQSQTIDISKYDTVTFDVHANPGCPTNAAGNICSLNVAFWTVNYQVHGGTNIDIPTSATNGWYHVTALVNKVDAPALAAGWAFNINCYGGANNQLYTNTTETDLWIDNIQVNVSKVPPKPPTLASVIKTPKTGLNLFSGGPVTDQYQRTNLRLGDTTTIPGMTDTGANGVEFALTIKDFPSGATFGGYQAHIFITSGPGTQSGMDYSDANLLFLDIKQNTNGTGSGTFRYKTNQPNGNSMVYGVGTLGSAAASTVLGTWKLKLSSGTNITVTGPDGTPFTTNITADAAALFTYPMSVSFGAQPNNPGNVGQVVVLSSVTISNLDTSAAIVNDNFLADSALDGNIWLVATGEPNTLFLFPADAGQKLVQWTLPDAGYGLQVTTNVTNPNSWTTLSGNEAVSPIVSFASSGSRIGLVPSANLGATQNYFRLFTRAFTKLQILMPGETAVPGTPTGKTGTPDIQSVGVPFNVTVNAVNGDWFLALTVDDTVHLASTDGTATLGADLPLSGGSLQIPVTFNTNGTFTVTVSDVTTPAKLPNTSTATQAQ